MPKGVSAPCNLSRARAGTRSTTRCPTTGGVPGVEPGAETLIDLHAKRVSLDEACERLPGLLKPVRMRRAAADADEMWRRMHDQDDPPYTPESRDDVYGAYAQRPLGAAQRLLKSPHPGARLRASVPNRSDIVIPCGVLAPNSLFSLKVVP